MKYLFILGNNPELSKAEILSVIDAKKIIAESAKILAVETDKLNCKNLMLQLGGTIKIAKIIGDQPKIEPILEIAETVSGKFKFGFSFYDVKPSNIGMQIKGKLKEKGISSRLVTSKEPTLSAVIITKEKCHDFIVTAGFFAQTCAVQDFQAFGQRDFGRPASDALSGMLPPKVARMMVNLSGADPEKVLLDPFCGSGTVLAEALSLGYTKLVGTDLSEKAIEDSKINLDWLITELKINDYNLKIELADAKNLSQKFEGNSIGAIVSEPYLGNPIKGNENENTLKRIVIELEELYLQSFKEFQKILRVGGRAVIVIPEWHVGDKILKMDIFAQIEKLGFKRLDNGKLIYKREGQKVWRNITIWEK
jgi:tRNA G10  N-methylase Trm11